MKIEDIRDEILNFIQKKYDIVVNQTQYDMNFFGNELKLSSRNVLDMIFSIEQKYNIRLNEDTLSNREIMTVNGLSNAIFLNLGI